MNIPPVLHKSTAITTSTTGDMPLFVSLFDGIYRGETNRNIVSSLARYFNSKKSGFLLRLVATEFLFL